MLDRDTTDAEDPPRRSLTGVRPPAALRRPGCPGVCGECKPEEEEDPDCLVVDIDVTLRRLLLRLSRPSTSDVMEDVTEAPLDVGGSAGTGCGCGCSNPSSSSPSSHLKLNEVLFFKIPRDGRDDVDAVAVLLAVLRPPVPVNTPLLRRLLPDARLLRKIDGLLPTEVAPEARAESA